MSNRPTIKGLEELIPNGAKKAGLSPAKVRELLEAVEAGEIKSLALVSLNNRGSLEVHYEGSNLAELAVACTKLASLLSDAIFGGTR